MVTISHETTMSALRASAVLAATYANQVTLTPPNPPASRKDTMAQIDKPERFFSTIVRRLVLVNKYLSWVIAGCELATLAARAYPDTPVTQFVLRYIMRDSLRAATRIRSAPVFFVGCGLAVAGALIRVQCYRALDSQFTFELTLKDNDKLITHGPYSVVRHPSYTGLLLNSVGQIMWCAVEGSWVRESGLLDTAAGRALAAMSVAVRVYASVTMVLRCTQEDRNLQGKFGAHWSEWARKVPYRLFPGVY